MTFEPTAGQQPVQQQYLQPTAQLVQPVQPVWTTPVRAPGAGAVALATSGIIVAGLALLIVLVYLSTFLGAGSMLFCLFLALIPLTMVLLAVRWIDRWDPEPRPARWFAFLWGAGVSIVTALIFDLGVQLTIMASGGALTGNDFVASVIQAPIVEEGAKGFGILLLFWATRKHFDGPVDGVVYAAIIAAGFAFSENIQYFGVAMIDGGFESLGVTFLVRGVLSPFAHVIFTICTGFALGVAARRTGSVGAIGYFVLGLVPAIVLHAVWNDAFFVFVADSSLVIYYFVVQVPLFIGAILVVIFLRSQEAKITVLRLGEYAAAGWFTPGEVAMLATRAGRRKARIWAATQPRNKKIAMRRFLTDATRLAFARQRMLIGKADIVDRADETQLLNLLIADRAELWA